MFWPLIYLNISYGDVLYTDRVRVEEDRNESVISDQSSASLGRDTIDDQVVTSLDDLLRSTPKATTTGGPRTSGESIQVRGLDASKSFLYIDGARQSFRVDHNSMPTVDPDFIKKVEVFDAPTGVRYGGGLSGGAEFTTLDPQDFLRGKEFGGMLKSYAQRSGKGKGLTAAMASKVDRGGVLLMAKQSKSEDLVLASGKTLENSQYDDSTYFTKIDQRLGANRFRLKGEFFSRRNTDPLNPTLAPPSDMTDKNGRNHIQRRLFGLDWDRAFGDNRAKVSFFQNRESIENIRQSDQRKEVRTVNTLGFRAENILKKSEWTWAVGIEGVRDSIEGEQDGQPLGTFPKGVGVELAPYTQLSLELPAKFRLIPAVRYYRYEIDSETLASPRNRNFLSKNLTLENRPLPGFLLKARYGEGFTGPRIQEVYINGFHFKGDGFFTADNYLIPNPDLRPATSQFFEWGPELTFSPFNQDDQLTLTSSMFWNHVKDYQERETNLGDPFLDEIGTTEVINIPEVSLRGLELGLDYSIGDFSVQCNYSRIRGVDKSRSLYLQNLPADQYQFQVQYEPLEYGLRIGYTGINALKQDRVNTLTTTQATEETPSYFVHNIFIRKSFSTGLLRPWQFGLAVENVTNRRYRRHASLIEEVGTDYKFSAIYRF